MSNAKNYNELLREYDQFHQLIPMLSEKKFDLVIPKLWKIINEIEQSVDIATSLPRRSIKEILAGKMGQVAIRNNNTTVAAS